MCRWHLWGWRRASAQRFPGCLVNPLWLAIVSLQFYVLSRWRSLLGFRKKYPTSGVFVHSWLERREYSCQYMMYQECPFVGWSSFLVRLVPAMSWERRCNRLLKLGLLCILSIVLIAVLMFSAMYFTMLIVCMGSVWNDHYGHSLQERCLWTLYFFVLTVVYRHCVSALRTRNTFTNRNLLMQCFSFCIVKHYCWSVNVVTNLWYGLGTSRWLGKQAWAFVVMDVRHIITT